MSTRAVIFDLDGLLVDSERLYEEVERALLAEQGATYDPRIARMHMGMGAAETAELMVREYRLGLAPERFSRMMIDALLARFEHDLETMPGAERLMAAALDGPHPVAIASGSPLRVVRAAALRFGWISRLDALCSAEEVARGKPAPDLFLLAAERLGVPASVCIALEDSVNGARAARAAGMEVVVVPNPVYRPEEFDGLADLLLPSLEHFPLERVGGQPEERE